MKDKEPEKTIAQLMYEHKQKLARAQLEQEKKKPPVGDFNFSMNKYKGQ